MKGPSGNKPAQRRNGFLPDVCVEVAESWRHGAEGEPAPRPAGAAVVEAMIRYFCCCGKGKKCPIVLGDVGQINQLLWHMETSGERQSRPQRGAGRPE